MPRRWTLVKAQLKLPTMSVFSSGQIYFKNSVVKPSVPGDLATANSFKASFKGLIFCDQTFTYKA